MNFSLRSLVAVCAVVLLLATLPGCSRHAGSRPVSALTEAERTTLERYEEMRAALATDDLRVTKRTANALTEYLKANAAAAAEMAAVSDAAKTLSAAPTLEAARETFKSLSADLIKRTDGVQGLVVIDSPFPQGAAWIQSNPKVDNPYMGKAMRDFGTVRK